MLQHPANGVDVIFAVALIFKVSGTGYIGEFKEASIVVLYVSCPGGEVTGATGQRGVAVLGEVPVESPVNGTALAAGDNGLAIPAVGIDEHIASGAFDRLDEANKFFKLNPYVADIPEKYAKDVGGVKLLVMGTVDVGGSGCVCPEHVMLKAILSSLTYRKDDVVILDMEAGLEHLGRGTAANMDQFIVVVEPGARSIQTYANVKRLAADLGVRQGRVVANKVRDQRDEDFVRSAVPEADFLGCIHYNPEIMDADRLGKSPYDFCPAAIEEIRKIKAIIDRD